MSVLCSAAIPIFLNHILSSACLQSILSAVISPGIVELLSVGLELLASNPFVLWFLVFIVVLVALFVRLFLLCLDQVVQTALLWVYLHMFKNQSNLNLIEIQ